MNELANILGISIWVFVLFIVWSIIWKGWALWTAARNNAKAWFIALLIVNTVGILEILYIFFFSKRSSGGAKKTREDAGTVIEIDVEKE